MIIQCHPAIGKRLVPVDAPKESLTQLCAFWRGIVRAISTGLALVVSLAIVGTLRAADAAEGRPPRLQNFGLPLDQLNLTDA